MLQHPDQAQKQQTISVDLLNSYMYITNGSVLSSDVTRDSLHVAIGLPEGNWTVVSVAAYAAPHFRPLKDLDGMSPDRLLKVLVKFE